MELHVPSPDPSRGNLFQPCEVAGLWGEHVRRFACKWDDCIKNDATRPNCTTQDADACCAHIRGSGGLAFAVTAALQHVASRWQSYIQSLTTMRGYIHFYVCFSCFYYALGHSKKKTSTGNQRWSVGAESLLVRSENIFCRHLRGRPRESLTLTYARLYQRFPQPHAYSRALYMSMRVVRSA